MGSSNFRTQRAHLLGLARVAVQAWGRGEREPARRCLASWAFVGDLAWVDALLDVLMTATFEPDPASAALWLAPELPENVEFLGSGVAAAMAMRAALRERGVVVPHEPAVWALACLGWVGQHLERAYREPWREERLVEAPARDQEAAAMLQRTLREPWAALPVWRRLTGGPMLAAFGVSARFSAESAWADRVVRDAREALLMRIAGPVGSPGWVEMVVRALELGGSPLSQLSRQLDDDGWRRLSSGLLVRRNYAETARRAWPDWTDQLGLAGRVAREGAAGAERVEAFVDLHSVGRLIARWSAGEGYDPASVWSTVLVNHRRARARLRAVLIQSDRERLVASLLKLPGTRARLDRAARLYGRAWASSERERGFSFDLGAGVDVPCAPRQGAGCDRRRKEPEWALLRVWALDAVLRGMFDDLDMWLRTAAVRKARKSRWDSHLDRLRAAVGADTGRASWGAARWALSFRRNDLGHWLRAVLREVSVVPIDRGGGVVIKRVLAPYWHEALPPRERGVRKMVQHAHDAIVDLDRAGW